MEAHPGDIIAVAGIETITLGETLADLENPHALPLITVDEPSISMTLVLIPHLLLARVEIS